MDRRSFLKTSAGASLLLPAISTLGIAPHELVTIAPSKLVDPTQVADGDWHSLTYKSALMLDARAYGSEPYVMSIDGAFLSTGAGGNLRWVAAPGEELFAKKGDSIALIITNNGPTSRIQIRRLSGSV